MDCSSIGVCFLDQNREEELFLESTLSSLTPSEPSDGDIYVFSPQGKETYATTYIGKKTENDTLPNANAKLKQYEGVQIHQSEDLIFEATIGSLELRSTTLLALENCIRNFTQIIFTFP